MIRGDICEGKLEPQRLFILIDFDRGGGNFL